MECKKQMVAVPGLVLHPRIQKGKQIVDSFRQKYGGCRGKKQLRSVGCAPSDGHRGNFGRRLPHGRTEIRRYGGCRGLERLWSVQCERVDGHRGNFRRLRPHGRTEIRRYPDYLLYTRIVDRFAAEYMERVLCRKIVANRAGSFLIRNYENTLRQIIEKQRKQHSRNSYFENIVKMVADLRKRQGVKP